jgi:hypothetical protein
MRKGTWSTPSPDGIQVFMPDYDTDVMAREILQRLHRVDKDSKQKLLKVKLQQAYEYGLEDGKQDENYYDKV